MPAIIVISNPNGKGESTVTFEERIVPQYLDDDHAAAKLVERLGWAILDAEELEVADVAQLASPADRGRSPRRSGQALAA